MLQIVSGDLFSSGARVLVNTVNCVGAMGKGIALEFKTRFPDVLEPYQRACRDGSLRPGRIHWHQLADGRWIANFPTKDDWRQPSELPWIESGLIAFVGGLLERDLKTVAMPALGCSNGGLMLSDVLPLVEQAFELHPEIDVDFYRPVGDSDTDPVLTFGPYRGKRVSQVPASQLKWLAANATTPKIAKAAKAFLANQRS